jgi:hypothetical protein
MEYETVVFHTRGFSVRFSIKEEIESSWLHETDMADFSHVSLIEIDRVEQRIFCQ